MIVKENSILVGFFTIYLDTDLDSDYHHLIVDTDYI